MKLVLRARSASKGLALDPCLRCGLVKKQRGPQPMQFEHPPRVKDLQARLLAFQNEFIAPNEKTYYDQLATNRWLIPPILEELKAKARAAGLWNLFLPDSRFGAGLTNVEYA